MGQDPSYVLNFITRSSNKVNNNGVTLLYVHTKLCSERERERENATAAKSSLTKVLEKLVI